MRACASVALAAALAVTVAACSGETRGSPTEVDNSQTTSQSPGSSNLPKIPEPIDTAQLEQKPCSVLTEQQLADLSISTEPQPDLEGVTGPVCEWDSYDETGLTLSGTFITKGGGGSLSDLYEKYSSGAFKEFRPIKVSDYPGFVRPRPELDDFCSIVVALRKDQVYAMNSSAASDSQYYDNPCKAPRRAAEMAVETMKQGGS